MFRKLLNTLIRWAKELWSLFEIIEEVVPAGATTSPSTPIITYEPQMLEPKRRVRWFEQPQSRIARHRYIELDGFAENFRIDQRGRYDILQLAKFAEHFVWVCQDAVEEFIDDSMDYDKEFIDGSHVLWLNKADCIEFCYHQYSALADLL